MVRASYFNTGTGIPEEELAWPETSGRVTRLPRLHVEVAERSTVTPYGRLSLAAAFLKRFRVAQEATNRLAWAEGIPESPWKPFRTRDQRQREAQRRSRGDEGWVG